MVFLSFSTGKHGSAEVSSAAVKSIRVSFLTPDNMPLSAAGPLIGWGSELYGTFSGKNLASVPSEG
jgi:hypothetical protein